MELLDCQRHEMHEFEKFAFPFNALNCAMFSLSDFPLFPDREELFVDYVTWMLKGFDVV